MRRPLPDGTTHLLFTGLALLLEMISRKRGVTIAVSAIVSLLAPR